MVLHRNQKLNLLRIVVLLTVALAGLKFFFRDSFTLDQRKDTSGESGFWGKAGELKQSAKPWDGLPALLETKVAAAGQESRKQPVWDFSTTQMRLVHLDLKGAAPKVSYLEQVFPLFSKLGANGILIEYEDMFPFKGELEVLKSPYAYSEEDVERIQNLAEINKLEVIPLVQTFGHVEVFHLGEGMDSKNWLSRNAGDVGKMFLNHIREVVDFIASQDWGFQVLMWDDMLRKVSVAAVQDSGIAQHASPMLWFYAPNFDAQQIGKYVSKYAECGFKTIWFASAFKGTTGPAQAWTPLHHHLQNHLQWLSVMRSVAKAPSTRLQGIALTGWQRYDHYSALCELLPVGIPSLAVCLQTLVNGGFNEAAKKKVLEILGFQSLQLEKSTCVGSGAFPGLDIYRMVEQVNSQLKDSVLKVLEEESSIKGWFSPYHRKHLFGNQHATHAERAYRQAKKCIKVHEDWENFIQTLRSHMEAVYFPDTVEEWMEENVNPHLDRLREFVRDFREVIRLNARPKKTL
ncbi:hexosaminidase D-like isoform X2 [Sphaerodactylus townsendi]|uniref:hexosaminidase D-like isoform X2 n=1 Tax=Sphaerodactylus townsendi TaxID=933632 RepID=UPI002025CCC2|nr:hexosaminidase D-like isoform X2 [Sphaerodactylus townsendi]